VEGDPPALLEGVNGEPDPLLDGVRDGGEGQGEGSTQPSRRFRRISLGWGMGIGREGVRGFS